MDLMIRQLQSSILIGIILMIALITAEPPPPPPPLSSTPPTKPDLNSPVSRPKILKWEGKTEFSIITRPQGKPEAFFISDWGRLFPDVGGHLMRFLQSKNRVTMRLNPIHSPAKLDYIRRPQKFGPPPKFLHGQGHGQSKNFLPHFPRNCGDNSKFCGWQQYNENGRLNSLESAESQIHVQKVAPTVTVAQGTSQDGGPPDIIIKLVIPPAQTEAPPTLVYAPPPDLDLI